MNSCPNIARGEVRKRLFIGYVGLFGTIITIMYTVFFNQDHLRFLIFFPAILTTVTFFEASNARLLLEPTMKFSKFLFGSILLY